MSRALTAVALAVDILLIRDGRVLLLRRKGSGYFDGFYAAPGGRVEMSEGLRAAAIRELEEETGLRVAPVDVQLAVTLYNREESTHGWIQHYFHVTQWAGEPKLCEPEKCDDMQWFSLDALPEKTVPYLQQVLDAFQRKESYVEYP